LQIFEGTRVGEVRFWCLQAVEEQLLHHYSALEDSARAGLRTWLQTLACQNPGLLRGQGYLANKLAQVYALLMRHEYPNLWPHALTALLSHLQMGEDVIDMFLRVLRAVDAEIINVECHGSASDAGVAMRVKDGMRLQCMSDIAGAWYLILQTFHQTRAGLVQDCLRSMAAFIPWLDIHLIVNDKFVPALYSLLEKDEFVEEVAACLTEIVLKKMEPAAKRALISSVIDLGTLQSSLERRSKHVGGHVEVSRTCHQSAARVTWGVGHLEDACRVPSINP
jgi:exportin-T